jgi:hypothetical protein
MTKVTPRWLQVRWSAESAFERTAVDFQKRGIILLVEGVQ